MKNKILGSKNYGDFKATIYQTGDDIIVHEISGFMLPTHISAYINDLIDYAITYRPKCMIADASEMKVLNQEVQEAIQKDFWPVVATIGVIYNPIVMPKSVLSSGSVERMVETQTIDMGDGNRVEIGMFQSLQDTIDWVNEQIELEVN